MKNRACFASNDPCLLALGKRTFLDCGLVGQALYFHGLLHNPVRLSIDVDLLNLKVLLNVSADDSTPKEAAGKVTYRHPQPGRDTNGGYAARYETPLSPWNNSTDSDSEGPSLLGRLENNCPVASGDRCPGISKPFSLMNWGHSGVGREAMADAVGVGNCDFSVGVDEEALAGTPVDGG